MAQHKAKVIGPFEVCGVKPGRSVVLDDDVVNIDALLAARHVELVVEKPATKKQKGDD